MSEVMSIRVDRKTKRRLEKLAKATAGARSWLAAEAIRNYVELNEWQIEEIQSAVKEAGDRDTRWIDHAEVKESLASWGASRERKPPL